MHNAEILGATHRKQRTSSEKTRTCGVDVEGIKEQVKEKRKQEEEDKKKQDAHAANMLHNSRVASVLQSREEKEKRAMEKAIVSYRHQHQHDPNDPRRCGRTDPADAQMMLPGLAGEDPDSGGRLRRQREQLREWLVQQQREREARRRRLQAEERRYVQSTEDMNAKAAQLERLEVETRKAAAVNTQEYNKAKVKAEEKRQQEQDRMDKASQAEATKQLLMGADVSVPGLCPGSDRRDPPESLQQVLQYQQYQIEEKRRIEMMKKQEEDREERVRLDSARAALLIERQQAKLNRQLRQHLDSTNVKLAEIHEQSKPDIERGHIDDSFFSKFNTSRR
ncbi:RIB43A-like with coiled-coils protein 2 [Betta splendens]|uniref:RIB43A-like with coiled-coils protein 2 n=1 Tax=Betta splendens TaxID=158456 RepID=A0A6P7MPF4_BETSP|nr:RIB43A-like with coiled-coils protein 2 [Betta splendens]